MRKLKTTDAFKFMRLMKESGVRDEFIRVALLVKQHPGMDIEKIGADLILGLFEGLSNKGAEDSFFEFASGILEMDIDMLKDMDLIDFFNVLASYKEVESAEEWKSFFSVVASLMR